MIQKGIEKMGAPRLMSVQNEMNCLDRDISIRRMVEAYDELWGG
jgi:hypothetical protein